ncbi:unnamed protein product [Ilex paraguariensis]|uniref:Uncharacterized protein n=1 Tax=Ilex paraguariensis TaxID=185542 RepID=A0ABC8U052_9AQUA
MDNDFVVDDVECDGDLEDSEFYDSDYDLVEDDKLYDTYVDKDVEWGRISGSGNGVEKEKSTVMDDSVIMHHLMNW